MSYRRTVPVAAGADQRRGQGWPTKYGVVARWQILVLVMGCGIWTASQLTAAPQDTPDDEVRESPAHSEPPTPEARPLSKRYPIWVDRKRRAVIMDGVVCLRKGPLEMFACRQGSKEHESVVALRAPAHIAHAALLALGAESGGPAQWNPEYVAASGTPIAVEVTWRDAEGKLQRSTAQHWVRKIADGRAMDQTWVFSGSTFWKDDATGKEHYAADVNGDIICVSNFVSAMLDVPIRSPQQASKLLFEAYTERIPPRGTAVRVWLKPQLDKRKESSESHPPAAAADKGTAAE